MFTEMGHDVFSNGSYLDPRGDKSLPRPEIQNGAYFPDYESLARIHPKTELTPELIEPFDVIIVMHTPEWICQNWDKMKHKKVIWRSIGQSTKHVENMIRKMRYESMKIVRMSPMEQNIPDYLGADAIIRFPQDEEDLSGWTGNNQTVINCTQSLKGRRVFCHYDDIMEIINGFPTKIFGSGNDDLGALNGGELPYDFMKGQLRDNRVFVYSGTWPAPYTLAFEEAFMMGIPVVAIGKRLAEEMPQIASADRISFYEVESFIENGVNGFVSNNIQELRGYVHQLLQDHELAKRIGAAGRQKAISLFSKERIKKDWESFFTTI